MTLHAPLCCFVTNVFWSVAARTPSSIRYSSFAVPFIFSIFGISRHTDIHICDCSCKVIEFFEFFWTAVDLICDFRRICAYLYGDICKPIQNVFVWDLPERICLGAKFWRVCNFRIVLQQSIDNVSSGIFNLISKPNNSSYSMPYTCQIAHATTNLALQAKFVCVNARIIVRKTYARNIFPMKRRSWHLCAKFVCVIAWIFVRVKQTRPIVTIIYRLQCKSNTAARFPCL